MAASQLAVSQIDTMNAEELAEFIEDRRARADVLMKDACELEQEAAVARRTATDHISELAYARIKLRRIEEA